MLYLYNPLNNITTKCSTESLEEDFGAVVVERCLREQSYLPNGLFVSETPLELSMRQKLTHTYYIEDEKWVTIEGSNNMYEVSDYGRIRRIFKTKSKKFLMPLKRIREHDMSLNIKVYFKGKYREYFIAKLVAHHFLGPIPEDRIVGYQNKDPFDCRASNLFFKKRNYENETHSYNIERFGVEVCKISLETNKIIKTYPSAREAARDVGISHKTIISWCNNPGIKRRIITNFTFCFADIAKLLYFKE